MDDQLWPISLHISTSGLRTKQKSIAGLFKVKKSLNSPPVEITLQELLKMLEYYFVQLVEKNGNFICTIAH